MTASREILSIGQLKRLGMFGVCEYCRKPLGYSGYAWIMGGYKPSFYTHTLDACQPMLTSHNNWETFEIDIDDSGRVKF